MASSAADIEAEIRAKITAENAEIAAAAEVHAGQVVAHAKSISPVDTGDYKDAWRFERGPETSEGLPTFKVLNDDPIANLVEYGTVHMHEHAVAARTAAHFGGTEGGADE